jgi:hypothetical protein
MVHQLKVRPPLPGEATPSGIHINAPAAKKLIFVSRNTDGWNGCQSRFYLRWAADPAPVH